ncbi:MAG: hypothetical protein IJE05_03740 [Clostridia bacterium]|nr:hypothetical protein [Clostridia bacterium]
MKGQKGITLVALVITIIILIILVALAVAAVVGENGLFTEKNQTNNNTTIVERNESTKSYNRAINNTFNEAR